MDLAECLNIEHKPQHTALFTANSLFGYSGTSDPEDVLISTHLEASGSRFARWYIGLIVDPKFRHHGDGGLDDEGDDVRPHLLDVHAFGRQPVQHAGQGALAARALAVRVDEVAAVDVERVVRQVHEDMAQILLAWFLHDQNKSEITYLFTSRQQKQKEKVHCKNSKSYQEYLSYF